MDFLDRLAWTRPAPFLVVLFLPAVYLPGGWPWVALALTAAGVAVAVSSRQDSGKRTAALLAVGAVLALAWGVRTVPPSPAFWPFAVADEASGEGTVVAEAPVTRKGTVPFKFRVEVVRREEWAGRARAVVTVLGYRGPSPAMGSRWAWAGLIDADKLIWKSGRTTGWTAPWCSATRSLPVSASWPSRSRPTGPSRTFEPWNEPSRWPFSSGRPR